MNLRAQLDQINALLPLLAVPALVQYLQEEITGLTEKLISADNEQTRGRIKALRDLIDLPETLQHERDGIAAALSEESDAAQ